MFLILNHLFKTTGIKIRITKQGVLGRYWVTDTGDRFHPLFMSLGDSNLIGDKTHTTAIFTGWLQEYSIKDDY